MSNSIKHKICQICGDVSCGTHFNAITCESCKSFFSRNGLKESQLKCYLGGNCEITFDSRKRCKRCRLNKCLAVGMKTNLIYSRKHKKDNKCIQRENQSQVSIDSNTSSCDELSLYFLDDNPLDDNQINGCNSVIEIEDLYSNTNEFVLTSSDPEYNMVPVIRPVTDYSIQFNELEGMKFNELLNGIKTFQINGNATDKIVIDDLMSGLNLLLTKHDNGIRDIIKMSKLLAEFNSLCKSDQMILIKYSSIEINIIRMISIFNFEQEHWNIVLNNRSYLVNLDIFRGHSHGIEIYSCYEYHKMILQYMGHDWESDDIILDFLTAILLFNPNRPKLIHKQMVKYQQQVYIYLFHRYLSMKYRSKFLANAKFLRLKTVVKYLNVLSEQIVEHSKGDDLSHAPLYREICDRN